MNLQCIIVDDEPIARKGLEEDIRQIGFIDIIGVAESSFKALELVAIKNPDLIFLDIEMPRLNGLDFIKNLKNPPMVIITTAYSKYALQGYELDVIDYLMKPIDFNRLLKSCTKAKEFEELKNNKSRTLVSPTDHFLFVKFNGKFEKIFSDEILFIEAANNYVILHTPAKKILTYDSLKNILINLPADNFIKVHKSYIVAIGKVSSVEKNEINISGTIIPISRNLKDTVMQKILNNRIP
jgi:DNA-binding LytR/AlgR family response regulator